MIARLRKKGDARARLVYPKIDYAQCPAKTYTNSSGEVELGRKVADHCLIVGEIANALVDQFPEDIRDSLFPEGSSLVAAAHDIGKVSPCFVEKIGRACTERPSSLPKLSGVNPDLERQWGGHAGVSQLTAKAINTPEYIAEILGHHHGFAPSVRGRRANDEIFGGSDWQQERESLVEELKTKFGAKWPELKSFTRARALSGLVSVSDWIGSGEFFEDPNLAWKGRIDLALDGAGFVLPKYRTGQSFEDVFGFQPYEPQQKLIDSIEGPGVYVLEAPMGLGKTEAALYSAYRMLETGKATGIYFALPTQLTSNKIYGRFQVFLSEILANGCPHRSLLLHANAWMLTEFGEEGRPGGAWFNQAKRGLLAPFAVGTIDQALMAAMNVKHGFVRAFGLAGKVVILDEVHTYDAYTGTLLDALVAMLRELHCTVIILSATLNKDRREQIVAESLSSNEYPLITAVSNDQTTHEYPVVLDEKKKVIIKIIERDDLAVEEALSRAVDGQQVLWIENTVKESQECYRGLAARAAELGISCGLLHSRFIFEDRQGIEQQWVDRFGKPGWPDRLSQGSILVGTQVLEQSLDIDADFLVSRFAPSDMLLQRLGRLWRNDATPRADVAVCESWIIAPALEDAIDNPQSAFGSSAFVYSGYVLCRSLEVWHELSSIILPLDIRSLIERTYETRDETGNLARYLNELLEGTRRQKGQDALQQLARLTLSEEGNTLPEVKAQTRYSELESYEVLLFRSLNIVTEKRITEMTLMNGEKLVLPCYRYMLDKQGWRQLSAKLMSQIVRVPAHNAPNSQKIEILNQFGFQHCFYIGNPNIGEAILRVALVNTGGDIIGLHGEKPHDLLRFEYRDDLGYQIRKQG